MSSCESSSCKTQPSSSSGCSTQSEPTPCNTQSCCPVEKAIEMWQKSFCEAMRGVMVDILKEKIRARWGEKMSREGDAVVSAMETQWQSMLAAGKAKHQMREEIKNIIIS